MTNRPLRVAIDARLVHAESGGLEQVVLGLAHGLSALAAVDEEYLFCAWSDEQEWLRPYVGGPAEIWDLGPRRRLSGAKKRLERRAPIVPRAWRSLRRDRHVSGPPRSDGTVEASGAELIHFTHQSGFLTDLPTIYHPHDLQHVHLPQFFSDRDRRNRAATYRTLARRAALVAVATSWVKRDVVEHLGVSADHVAVVPLAPFVAAYLEPTAADLERTRLERRLPGGGFALYPAQTWAHKNHLGLVEALALLRDEYDLRVPLVASGRLNDFYPVIERRVVELGLSDQVHFVGFVSPLELQCLYRLSTMTVIPTKFEAASGPLWDAFLAGSPAACSNVTALPEQAGDAALLFDPDDPREIAAAIRRLWLDEELRATLVARAAENVGRFSWDRTARIFRAHYRRIAGRALTDEDRSLLDSPPLF